MVERAGRLRFQLKPLEPFAIHRESRQQHFDRHFPTQPRILRPIDLTHAARAQWGKNFVRSDLGSGI